MSLHGTSRILLNILFENFILSVAWENISDSNIKQIRDAQYDFHCFLMLTFQVEQFFRVYLFV